MAVPRAVMAKVQFKIKPEEALVAELEKLARKYRQPSANHLALEIIEQYLTHWEQAEKARQAFTERQKGIASKGPLSEQNITALLFGGRDVSDETLKEVESAIRLIRKVAEQEDTTPDDKKSD
jgi:hypothetical protein